MSENALAVRTLPQLALNTMQDVLQLGDVFARSGYFADARGAAQAVVKILAGRELGFGPMASMVGVHIVEGKPSVGSHLIAAAIRGSGRYDYEIVEHTDQVCVIRFKRRLPDGTWKDLEPVERLTLQEAVNKGWTVSNAGKPKTPWVKTPKNMLFARCLTNGYRFHCPDLANGVLMYDPDELESGRDEAAEVRPQPTPPQTNDPPGGIVDASFEVVPDAPPPPPPIGPPSILQQAMGLVPPPPPGPPAELLTDAQRAELVADVQRQQIPEQRVNEALHRLGVPVIDRVPAARYQEMRELLFGSEPMTAWQRDKIDALVGPQGLGLDAPVFLARVNTLFGTTPDLLTRIQAGELIQRLQSALTKPQTAA